MNGDNGLMARTNALEQRLDALENLVSILVNNLNGVREEIDRARRVGQLPPAAQAILRARDEQPGRNLVLEQTVALAAAGDAVAKQSLAAANQVATLPLDPAPASQVDPMIAMAGALADKGLEQNMPERPDPFVRRKPKHRTLAGNTGAAA